MFSSQWLAYLRSTLGMALLTMAGQGRQKTTRTKNSMLAWGWGKPWGWATSPALIPVIKRCWFYLPTRLPSLPSLSALPVSQLRLPLCFTCAELSSPRLKSLTLSPTPLYSSSTLLPTPWATPSLKTFHWLPIAHPIKHRLLSMAGHCGTWLLLTTNPALPPPAFPTHPKFLPSQIRDLRHGSLRSVLITIYGHKNYLMLFKKRIPEP